MFKKIILHFFPAKRLMLGRWCLHDTSKIAWKIDMANIDHCGTCALIEDKSNVEKNAIMKTVPVKKCIIKYSL